MRQPHDIDQDDVPDSLRPIGFGEFTFDPQSLELRRSGALVPIELQPAKVLAVLLQARGTLVTREELVQAVWGGRFLSRDQSINYCIRRIRAALGDDASQPRFVRTLPRRGYLFLADLGGAGARVTSSPRSAHHHWWFVSVTFACAIGAAVASQLLARDTSPTGPGWRDDHAVARQLTERARVQYLMATRWLATRKHPGYSAIIAVLDSVIAEHPGFLPAVIHRAEALLWSGRVAEARQVLDSLLRESPDVGQVHTLRGALAVFRDGDPWTAADAFERGLRLAPWSSEAHHYAAYGAIFSDNPRRARREMTRALELDPLSPTLDGDAGMVFYYLGDHDTADSLCARAVRTDSTMRAPVLCRVFVAAARDDTVSLAQAAALLARIDAAPMQAISSNALDGVARQALFRWEAARAAVRPGVPSGSLLMRLRWMVLAGDTDSARALMRTVGHSGDASRVLVPFDPLVVRTTAVR